MKPKNPKIYPWSLVRTAYHGGGLISQHRSAYNAVRAQWRLQMRSTDCVCGCYVVVETKDLGDLPHHAGTGSPYAGAF